MRIGPHHHPCSVCGARTECCGDIEQNYDGWPEWICAEYHGIVGTDVVVREFLCERCANQREDDAVA